MANLCMGCMNPLPQEGAECKVCGYDPAKDQNPEHCLPVGTVLQEHYLVGRLLGEFSDHLLYLAHDSQMREPCLIQEFYPFSIAHRDEVGNVKALEGCDRAFEEHAETFRRTMRVLARMRELPAVVPVYDIFEENGTLYAVSDHCQGVTLTKKIKMAGGRLPWSEARGMFMSLLSSLVQLSEAGICHLAICPDNILVGADGKARLRNFSIPAAHRSGTELIPDLKTGYAAPEQYYTEEEVGTTADVYGLAATIFRTVTGAEPPSGGKRAKNSDDLFMPAEIAEELTQPVCVALFNALQVLPENRTPSLAQLREELSVTPQVSALVNEARQDMVRAEEHIAEEEPVSGSGKGGLIAMLIISLVLLLAAVGVILFLLYDDLFGTDTPKVDGKPTASQSTTTTTKRPIVDGMSVVVEDVIGSDYYARQDDLINGMPLELVGFAYNEDYDEGDILYQYPAAGEEQVAGTPIQVIINNSRASSVAVIPDVAGWDKAHAKEYLEALGFKVEERVATSFTYERGKVEGTYPKIGVQKEVGDTITLLVSDKEPEPPVSDTPADTPVDTPDQPVNGDQPAQ